MVREIILSFQFDISGTFLFLSKVALRVSKIFLGISIKFLIISTRVRKAIERRYRYDDE